MLFRSVGVVLLVREHLLSLVPRLRSLRVKGVELVLEEVKREIEHTATSAGEVPAVTTEQPPPGSESYYETLAEVSPRAAMLEGWLAFEMAASDAVDAHGLSSRGRALQMPELFQRLRENDLILPEEETALTKLRAVRNEVVHARDFTLTGAQLAEYASLVTEIARRLEARSRERLDSG